ncbi:hypothetical protein [Ktedonobacter robiniae]|uniref:Uncharacterized protein n=1 Tax=Ktedonobacter robiniae TaxID=2778365 RepID=A0ABQ3UTE8_9CHLR|nr:hypothetical protein [Ktedonobacter robiniae]GHO55942.1 hypothetical protein KSB_44170 [Ktedonobacter robiniae]
MGEQQEPPRIHAGEVSVFAGFLGVKRLGNHAYYYILPDKLKEVREGLASVEHLLQQRREDQL